MIQNTIFKNQNTLIVNDMIQNILSYGIHSDGWKILIYAQGEHDLGSAQNGRTSSEI